MIFYFSATGNSLYVAKKIGKETNTMAISISEVISHKDFHFTLAAEESVGFVFPTYFYGIPSIMKEFLSQLVLEGNPDPYLYLVLTCGTSTGNAGKMFEHLLNANGYKLSATHAVAMVDNYVLMFVMPDQEKAKHLLEAAEIKIDAVIEKIKSKELGDFNLIKGTVPSITSAFSYPLYQYGRKNKKFYVRDNCTHCGLCQKLCPSRAIHMENDIPVWKKNQCIHCLGCIHRCPVAAIEYGEGTIKRGRYVNPNVKFQ